MNLIQEQGKTGKAQLIEPGFCVIELKGEFDSLSKIPSGRQKFVKNE